MESTQKDIKLEPDEFNYIIAPGAPESENLAENPENPVDLSEIPLETKPAWFPSSKGRSIVWEHITWVAESQRAACNYCAAEFQVKGGTSALLRHLKTIHPAAINFDPENPPPVARRKRKKMEDYTIVTEDTKSYMDNLLEQFLNVDDSAPRGGLPDHDSPQHMLVVDPQSRADSEIDAVIRNLQQETEQNGLLEPEPDQALKKLLGIDDGRCEEVIAIAAPIQQDEEKQVSSSSGGAQTKKRRADEQKLTENPALNSGKFSLSILSAIRRPPLPSSTATSSSAAAPQIPAMTSSAVASATSAAAAATPMMPAKYNAQAVQILDFEAKVLYNQSLHSTIAREDAMTTYYRMKSRKLELEIKKLERELGEEQDEAQEHEE
ncbi:BED-type domain-containing protein [Caenorhabditis elegans]|uniref:BED-type domain-containing protein n=1 Tax=Caenorhabditis elegans TaxID=6239 RepID=Q8MYP3_CAEEL|nr:BED-type domain-containing protein [Caenorhabditis elegans]CAD31811.1 BED-type domain-containing protein [Caenorhabditis elegans]|eukprot:NP_001024227.1 BED-type zinc finger putative transcription factor [Caenorhabditis elegans]